MLSLVGRNSLFSGFFSWLFSGKLLLFWLNGGEKQEESFFYHPFPQLDRVVREEFILAVSAGKKVLHFGFLDSPMTHDKIASGALLHQRLRGVADCLYGIDIDSETLFHYRALTEDYDNAALDILDTNHDISFLCNKFDLILFPEVLEHVSNPGATLQRLKVVCSQNPGSTVVITVPNAFSLEHFRAAASGVEMVHPDHYYYFSPVTLKKLVEDAGFSQVDIKLYAHNQKALTSPGITSHGIIAACNP